MTPNSRDPIWIYPQVDPEWHKTIIKEFSIHPVTAYILASRNFKSLEEIHDYLYAKLPNLLDPQLFQDMDKAVNRVLEAFKHKEHILIYGDNDVDSGEGSSADTSFGEAQLKLLIDDVKSSST